MAKINLKGDLKVSSVTNKKYHKANDGCIRTDKRNVIMLNALKTIKGYKNQNTTLYHLLNNEYSLLNDNDKHNFNLLMKLYNKK